MSWQLQAMEIENFLIINIYDNKRYLFLLYPPQLYLKKKKKKKEQFHECLKGFQSKIYHKNWHHSCSNAPIFFFFSFYDQEVPRLGVESELHLRAMPQPQQQRIRATSVTHTPAMAMSEQGQGSNVHPCRDSVRFLTHWATRGTPKCTQLLDGITRERGLHFEEQWSDMVEWLLWIQMLKFHAGDM